MSGYDIGISGLLASQRAIDVIGNNIANAGTDGYHAQRVALTPKSDTIEGGVLIGQGVNINDVTRLYSTLLESEIFSQQSELSMSSRLLDSLQVVENTFGELASEGLSSSMDYYFESLNEMATDPFNSVLQSKSIRAAEQMTYEFRRMGSFLTKLENQLVLEAQNSVDQVNAIADQIAQLNADIKRIELQGATAGNMRDERDALITDLASLVDVSVYEDNSTYNITVGQMPLVIGTNTMPVQINLYVNEAGKANLGIAPKGTSAYTNNLTGGEIGAVFQLRNELVSGFHDKLDQLANSIITETNKVHIQGVGSNGSFETLAGWVMNTEELSEMIPPVQDGTIYIRVTDPSGNVVRHEIDIDAATDTITDVAAKFNAIPGIVDCGLIGAKFVIQTDTGYKFDFQGGVSPEIGPGTPPILVGAGESVPAVGGIYTGETTQTYTCEIIGDGYVGIDNDLKAEVTNELGQVVATFDIGSGYEANSELFVDEGIYLSFGPGHLLGGGIFTVETIADTDTSGFLASVGVNCLFSGFDASTMSLRTDIENSPERLAVSGGGDDTNGSIILQLASIGDSEIEALIGLTPEQFYQDLASEIGQEVSNAETKVDNANSIMKHLYNQRDQISGVDINTQATELLVYERMFQAMSQFLSVISDSNEMLMQIIQ